MKISSIFAGIAAAGLVLAPVVASAGTRASSASVSVASSLPAVRPAFTQDGVRRSSPVREAEGISQGLWVAIIVGGLIVGYVLYEVLDDSSGT